MSSPPASGPELGKAQRKSLASAGHLVERFAAACDLLQAHVKSGRVELQPLWRDAVAASGSCGLSEDGWFVLEFAGIEAGKLKLRPRPLGAEFAAQAIDTWKMQKQVNAAVETTLLPVPPALGAPLWLALLHLRQLHDFWERELRRSGLEQLLALMPDAWLADPAPLPPGAVVPRLEIGAWDELDQLVGAGQRFALASVGGDTVELSTLLKPMNSEEREVALVLAELESDNAVNLVRAIYEKKAARVEMTGMV